MYSFIDLSGKKILITGASSGMGRATAILCSKMGARVILIARSEDKLNSVMSELEGDGHSVYPCDLSRIEDIEPLIKRTIADAGPLDGFVHSAGIGSTRPLKMLKNDALNEVMTINFYSFIEIVRCITKKRCFNEGMSIVGISSIASRQGNQSKTAYSASKAAMDAAVRCLAKELAPKKIRVNTVNPAWIKTPIYDQFISNGGDSEDVKNILARQYLGLGEPDDVAKMITFLLCDASKLMTGSNVIIDGGRLSS